MRKERKGTLGRMTRVVEDLAAGQRRRQERREPRAAIYDAAGHARVLDPEAPGRDELLELAEEMSRLAVGE